MLVVEDEGLLAELMVSLQFVDVGFVIDDVLFVLLQAVHLFLQGTGDIHRHVADLLNTQETGRMSTSFLLSWTENSKRHIEIRMQMLYGLHMEPKRFARYMSLLQK